MNSPVTINNQTLPIKEYRGQRVVTFKDIDAVHDRPDGTARKRFNDNRKRFIQGVDFYKISPSEFRTAFGEMDIRQQNDITLLTESGYLMLAKSFTDDLAWKVQRELVSGYFRTKEIITTQAGKLNEMKIRASADRAAAMRMNAENRRLKLLLEHPHLKDLSPIAQQTWELKAVEAATGKDVGDFLPECGELKQASQLANEWTKEFGVKVTAAMLGKLANQNDLKTEEYGVMAMDKSPYSNKEMPSFRYNPKGVAKLKALAKCYYLAN